MMLSAQKPGIRQRSGIWQKVTKVEYMTATEPMSAASSGSGCSSHCCPLRRVVVVEAVIAEVEVVV